MSRLIRFLGTLWMISGMVWLTGCAMRPVKVESQWTEEAFRGHSFHDLLIVGVSPNYNIRCNYERFVAAQLRGPGIKATASCSYLDSTDPLTVAAVIPVVRKIHADAVLVTELIGRENNVVEGGSSETRGAAYYKPVGYGYGYRHPYYGGYGSFGLPVTYVEFNAEQSAFALETSVVVASNLYETGKATRVYSIQVTAKNQSRDGVLHSLSTAVADRLHRDGLVAAPGNAQAHTRYRNATF